MNVNVSNVSSTGPFSTMCQSISAGMSTAGSGGAAASSLMNGTSRGMYYIKSGSGGMVGGVSGGNVPMGMSG